MIKILKTNKVWCLSLLVMCSLMVAQTPSDTTQASDDPIFVCIKDSTKVYKWQAPDAPIVGRINKGDTLKLIWLSDNFVAIHLEDTIRGIVERKYLKRSLTRNPRIYQNDTL